MACLNFSKSTMSSQPFVGAKRANPSIIRPGVSIPPERARPAPLSKAPPTIQSLA